MTPPPWDYDGFVDRVTEWATDQPDVSAAIVVGSRARTDRPADVWSDVDIVLVTTNIGRYRGTDAWLEDLGDPWLSCHGRTPVGGFDERHVVYDPGIEVDFVPVDAERIHPLDALPDEVFAVFVRGYEFLVDKDELAGPLAARVEKVDVEALELALPDDEAFVETVHDALYHELWVAKKLRRGELWTATRGVDGYLKWECLLPMLKWHARAVHGRASWHAGRFLEEWADERAIAELEDAFAEYDTADCWDALAATMALFRWVARETSEASDYDYPEAADAHVRELVAGLAPE